MACFPAPCLLCGSSCESGVCPNCARALKKLCRPNFCQPVGAERGLTLFPYGSEEIQKLLFLLKDRGLPEAVNFFASALEAHLGDFGVEFTALTFVPRRAVQRRRDGFDHAELLARELSRKTGIPMLVLLRRCGFSRRQHGLSKEERAENVAGKFRALGSVRGNLLLLDDILTTGATVEEASRSLREAGPQRVYALAPVRGG